jgi:hypothetical protein
MRSKRSKPTPNHNQNKKVACTSSWCSRNSSSSARTFSPHRSRRTRDWEPPRTRQRQISMNLSISKETISTCHQTEGLEATRPLSLCKSRSFPFPFPFLQPPPSSSSPSCFLFSSLLLPSNFDGDNGGRGLEPPPPSPYSLPPSLPAASTGSPLVLGERLAMEG